MYVVNECWITFQSLGPQSNLRGAGGGFLLSKNPNMLVIYSSRVLHHLKQNPCDGNAWLSLKLLYNQTDIINIYTWVSLIVETYGEPREETQWIVTQMSALLFCLSCLSLL